MKLPFKIACLIFLVVAHMGNAQEVRIRLENCVLEKETVNEIQNSFHYQLQFYAHIFGDQTMTGFKARIFGTEKEFFKVFKRENKLQSSEEPFYCLLQF